MVKERLCPWCKKKLKGDWQYEMHVQYNIIKQGMIKKLICLRRNKSDR